MRARWSHFSSRQHDVIVAPLNRELQVPFSVFFFAGLAVGGRLAVPAFLLATTRVSPTRTPPGSIRAFSYRGIGAFRQGLPEGVSSRYIEIRQGSKCKLINLGET